MALKINEDRMSVEVGEAVIATAALTNYAKSLALEVAPDGADYAIDGSMRREI